MTLTMKEAYLLKMIIGDTTGGLLGDLYQELKNYCESVNLLPADGILSYEVDTIRIDEDRLNEIVGRV